MTAVADGREEEEAQRIAARIERRDLEAARVAGAQGTGAAEDDCGVQVPSDEERVEGLGEERRRLREMAEQAADEQEAEEAGRLARDRAHELLLRQRGPPAPASVPRAAEEDGGEADEGSASRRGAVQDLSQV